jgi:hypothetical protein
MVLEKSYSDHLEAAFHSQLKRTQLVGESLHEFAADIYHLPHCAHVELPEHLTTTEAIHPFNSGIRERGIDDS